MNQIVLFIFKEEPQHVTFIVKNGGAFTCSTMWWLSIATWNPWKPCGASTRWPGEHSHYVVSGSKKKSLVGDDWNILYLFFHILGIIIPTDYHIFWRGRYTTNQISYGHVRIRVGCSMPLPGMVSACCNLCKFVSVKGCGAG